MFVTRKRFRLNKSLVISTTYSTSENTFNNFIWGTLYLLSRYFSSVEYCFVGTKFGRLFLRPTNTQMLYTVYTCIYFFLLGNIYSFGLFHRLMSRSNQPLLHFIQLDYLYLCLFLDFLPDLGTELNVYIIGGHTLFCVGLCVCVCVQCVPMCVCMSLCV